MESEARVQACESKTLHVLKQVRAPSGEEDGSREGGGGQGEGGPATGGGGEGEGGGLDSPATGGGGDGVGGGAPAWAGGGSGCAGMLQLADGRGPQSGQITPSW